MVFIILKLKTKKLQYEHDLTEKKLSIKNFIHTKSKDMNY
jgi:hypothetical protein